MSAKPSLGRIVRRLAILFTFCAGLACASYAQASPESAAAPHLFGSVEFRGRSLAVLPQWTRVLDKIKAEQAKYAACDNDPHACFPALAAWRAKIREVKTLDRKTQLLEINRFLNKWPYREDLANYGVADYWASPLEFLRNSGDCEDYAIIKYVTLKALGFDVDSLRIVVVQDTLRNVTHAVLAVYMDKDVLIMDSLFDGVLTQDHLTFYMPQYSINETTLWVHIMPMPSALNSAAGSSIQ
jgi:predicted transglutaminase-like cysteine proteinase